MRAPDSLTHPDLAEVWASAAKRLELRGADNRGRLRLPPLTSRARLALRSLMGRKLNVTIDLSALEQALVALGVGTDLPSALAQLGAEVSAEPADRRASRRAASHTRETARAEAVGWPEPWASEWIDGVIKAGLLRGLSAAQAARVVASVRIVLDRLPGTSGENAQEAGGRHADPISRVDLAATALGDSHALDTGSRLEAATARALTYRFDSPQSRELWERAGAHTDLVSGAALTWALPVVENHPLAALVANATDLRIPIHLTQYALRRHPVVVAAGTTILVAENPRVVEAAAQGGNARPVIATNGNPSGAVRMLLRQLLDAGAVLLYHGDFDAAGLAICARLAHIGLVPWRMTTADYQMAVRAAEADGVQLPLDTHSAGPTLWDPGLQQSFNADRRVIHEERLLAELLSERRRD